MPPESRPCGCSLQAAAQEQAAIAAGQRAAVIVITHNEAGCVLRRTLLAVLGRTPSALLHEVLVLDDASEPPAERTVAAAGGLAAASRADAAGSLADAARLVRWQRGEARLGVARARAAAVAATSAPVMVFLDAHCEPQLGWLPPLLDHLRREPRAIALPVIESIDPASFAYVPLTPAHAPPRGVFDWNLTFHWRPRPHEPLATPAPCEGAGALANPAMAGGIFAVGRRWFDEAGGYDEGQEVWGGENVEMSIRVWSCGGSLATLPCSRVGHVFRSRHPFRWPRGAGLTLLRNARRVAEVWMDEAKSLVGGRARFRHLGDLEERRALRRRLRCRPFRWYLENIFPDHDPLPRQFRWTTPRQRPKRLAVGKIDLRTADDSGRAAEVMSTQPLLL